MHPDESHFLSLDPPLLVCGTLDLAWPQLSPLDDHYPQGSEGPQNGTNTGQSPRKLSAALIFCNVVIAAVIHRLAGPWQV